ncbi:MAG: hypothetical protein WB562_10620 [Candidatus Sulfotelmatobacter sp.]
MTRGKYRKKKQRQREADLARKTIMNADSQKPNPATATNQRQPKPDKTKAKRPPSTVGEIIMAVFVGATVIIYVVLTGISVETMHVDQRAWISQKESHIVAFAADKPFQLDVVLQNTGKTPALHITEALAYRISDTSMNGPTPDMISVLRFGPQGAIGPQGAAIMQIANAAPMRFYEAIEHQRTKYLYFNGEIRYSDIFGNKHTTTFCLVYVPEHTSPPVQAAQMLPCYEGNDMN